MRIALALLLVTALAAARGRLTDPQKQQLIQIIGEKTWKGLPDFRKRMIEARYAGLVRAPSRKQAEVRRRGLRDWLIKPRRRFKLPQSLKDELERLPPEVRPLATRMVVMRLRQLRLDRHLSLIPSAERRAVFLDLFPEPFDPSVARKSRRALELSVAKAMAGKVRQALAKDASADKQELVHRIAREEEERIFRRIRREIPRGRDPGQIRRRLERQGFHLIERAGVPPRTRELIRYALRPHECPFLDLRFLGPRPGEPRARRLWEHDFRVLARLDLLLVDSVFPKEMVLHLAETGSAEDFFRAAKALRRGR